MAVRAEEMFEVETEYTSAALKTALALEEWWKGSHSNREILTSFAHVLRVRLDACFPCCRSTLQLKKERMWGAYHRFRTADTFVHDWRVFLTKSVNMKAFPAFYQFVTHAMFKELIKAHYPVLNNTDVADEMPSRPLTHVEQNALRYVAGYVTRKLRFNIMEDEIRRFFTKLWSYTSQFEGLPSPSLAWRCINRPIRKHYRRKEHYVVNYVLSSRTLLQLHVCSLILCTELFRNVY